MNQEGFKQQLINNGFSLIGIPVTTGGSYVYSFFLPSGIELVRVDIPDKNSTVKITKGKSELLMLIGEESLRKALGMVESAETEVPNEQDIESAKLIKEVKTLRLQPTDKIAVIVKDDVNTRALENLQEAMVRWLGEKYSGRVMILKGDVDLVKIGEKDGIGNQEESS